MTTGRIIAVIIVAAVVSLHVLIHKTRTATVTVAGDIQISLTVLWGLGMQQTVSVRRGLFSSSSLTEDVWDKPSEAGGPIYVDEAQSIYYVALANGVYLVDVMGAKVTRLCSVDDEKANLLVLVGAFSLVSGGRSQRGDNVVFVPAGGQRPPITGAKAGHRAFKNRCG